MHEKKMKQLFREEGFASFWLLKRIAKAVLPHWLVQGVLQNLHFRGRRDRIFQEKAKLSGCAARLPPNISPKVSFLVAAYNYEEYIGKCLQSVLAQRDVAWDLLIVDDCSSDQTWNICRDYAEHDSRIRAVRLEQNLGQYQIVNRYSVGLAGEYCCVLDADDYLAPEYVGKMYERAKAGDFDVVLCRHQNMAEGKKLFVHDYGATIGRQGWNHSLFWPLLQLEYFIVDCGTLVKTELRRRVYAELPNVRLHVATDCIQGLFLARHARSIVVCKKVLYYYNQSSSGTWRNNSEAFCIKKLASALVDLQVIQELACEELGLSVSQIECIPDFLPMAQNIWNMALQAVAGLSAQQREELSTKLLEFSSRYQNGLLSPQILKKWETKWQNELQAETIDKTNDKTKSPQKLADAGTLWTARRIAKTRIKEALRRAKCYLPYFLFCLLWRIRRGKYGLGHENCRGFRGFSLFPPGSSVRWFWYALPYGFVCRCLRYQKRNIAKK